MRQFFALIALSGALMLSAQSIKKETLTYARLQPPTDHSADGQSFKTTVNLTYKAEIERAEAAAEADYQAALAAYPAQEAAAKAAYDERVAAYEKALADWNNKSLAGKIIEKQVLENSKPVPPPPYQAPYPPQRKQLTHQALFSEAELAQSYGRIEGRTEAEGGIQVTITLYGFQNEPPRVETKESSVYNTSTKSTQKVIESQWVISHKHPVHLKAVAADGRVLIDEMVAGSDAFTDFKSGFVKSSHPTTYAQYHLDALQKSVVSANMTAAKNLLNSRLGTTHPTRTTVVFVPESKKADYSDLAEAFQIAREGFEKLNGSYDAGAAKLRAAEALWSKAITEFDAEDKKARINAKVIAELYRNVIEAEVASRDFAAAEAHLSQARRLDLSKKDKEAIEELAGYLSDYQVRF
ncbi:MAG: hypothetical protein ACO3PE_07760 [Schleiferiaceae bacterium]